MKKRFLTLLLAALLLTGCAGAAMPTGLAPEESRRLMIYTSHKEEVYRPIIREFEERTGIWAEIVTGGTSQLLERIEQEQAAPRADIMFGGGVETLSAHRELFRQADCPNGGALQEEFRQGNAAWTPFSALPVVLIYNTKLVDPACLTGWEDLLRPEFAGKIAFADPAKSASSFTALVTARYACGDEILEALPAHLEGRQLDSSGDVLSAVADGTYLVGITLEETAMQRIAAGDNLAIVYPKEGTSCVPDGTAVVLGAPHEENAVAFLDFTLSEAVQQLLGSRFYRRAVRAGVDAPEALPTLEDMALVRYDDAWAAENRDDILARWNDKMQEAAK